MYKSTGFSVTGKPTLGSPVSVRFSPIRLASMAQATSIRTDKSGSKSRADETIFKGRILVHPESSIDNGDTVEIDSVRYEVNEVFPRYDMGGYLNHYQVDLEL